MGGSSGGGGMSPQSPLPVMQSSPMQTLMQMIQQMRLGQSGGASPFARSSLPQQGMAPGSPYPPPNPPATGATPGSILAPSPTSPVGQMSSIPGAIASGNPSFGQSSGQIDPNSTVGGLLQFLNGFRSQ